MPKYESKESGFKGSKKRVKVFIWRKKQMKCCVYFTSFSAWKSGISFQVITGIASILDDIWVDQRVESALRPVSNSNNCISAMKYTALKFTVLPNAVKTYVF